MTMHCVVYAAKVYFIQYTFAEIKSNLTSTAIMLQSNPEVVETFAIYGD